MTSPTSTARTCPAAMIAAASSSSEGTPRSRAKWFSVPSGSTPSGVRRRPARRRRSTRCRRRRRPRRRRGAGRLAGRAGELARRAPRPAWPRRRPARRAARARRARGRRPAARVAVEDEGDPHRRESARIRRGDSPARGMAARPRLRSARAVPIARLVATTFAASPGRPRARPARAPPQRLRARVAGRRGHPLLRLVTQRDVETVYAEIAADPRDHRRPRRRPGHRARRGRPPRLHGARRLRRHRRPRARRARGRPRPPPVEAFARRSRRGPPRRSCATLLGWVVASSGRALLRGGSGYGDEARMFLRALDDGRPRAGRARMRPEGPRADLSLDTERLLRRCEQRARARRRGSLNVLHMMPLGAACRGTASTSCRTMFETESIPPHWRALARGAAAASGCRREFNVDSFERGGVDPRAPARPARHDRLRPLPPRRAAASTSASRAASPSSPTSTSRTARAGTCCCARTRWSSRARRTSRSCSRSTRSTPRSHDDGGAAWPPSSRRTGVPAARLPHIRILAERPAGGRACRASTPPPTRTSRRRAARAGAGR